MEITSAIGCCQSVLLTCDCLIYDLCVAVSKKSSVARDLFSQTHTDGVPLLVGHFVIIECLNLIYFSHFKDLDFVLLITVMAWRK